MDKQAIFNQVLAHMRKQGRPSCFPNTHLCAYRSDGVACAIGCLIPDDKYTREIERLRVSVITTSHPGLLQGILNNGQPFSLEDIAFLTGLQTCHDDKAGKNYSHSEYMAFFERYMGFLATTYHLYFPPIGTQREHGFPDAEAREAEPMITWKPYDEALYLSLLEEANRRKERESV